jgi:serine/threonine-protein kinase
MTETASDGQTLSTHLGHYRLEGLLGRGGMGEVHRAHDTRRRRTVALKLLSPALAHDAGFRERFRREAHAVARLSSPHIVPIHDFGEIDGRLFLDMRLIEGRSLDQLVADGPLDVPRAVAVVDQVAAALADAHDQGVVHRDVKPSNVLVTPDGFAYLVDFGIARAADGDTGLTATGATVGTLAYMAPERFAGGPPDARSDLYSLGCVLVECLTGYRPFPGQSLPTLMRAHLDAPPPRPSIQRPGVPAALDDVVLRAMRKDPRDRHPDARAFAADLRRAAMDRPGDTRALPMREQAGRQPVRTSVLLAAAAGIAVVAGGGGAVLGAGLLSSAPAATVGAPMPTHAPTAATSVAPLPPIAASPQAPSSSGRPSSYTFRVDSNYPITSLIYSDSKGDQVTRQSVPAPWSEVVSTAGWGADALPTVTAGSGSTKGDTTVTCTITDNDTGKVVSTKTTEKAFAIVSCADFGF